MGHEVLPKGKWKEQVLEFHSTAEWVTVVYTFAMSYEKLEQRSVVSKHENDRNSNDLGFIIVYHTHTQSSHCTP